MTGIECKGPNRKSSKQNCEFEDIRARTCRRRQNRTALVMAAARGAAARLGTRVKLETRAGHALGAAKRIYRALDFQHCALPDGLPTIVKRVGQGVLPDPQPDPDLPRRLALFPA